MINPFLSFFKTPYFYLFYFILNTQFLHSFEKFSNYRNYLETDEKYRLIKIVDDLNYPWGMTFIDDEHLLITEKKGNIIKVNIINGKKEKIKHNIKNIISKGQGGLLDIISHNDGFIYFTYSHGYKKESKGIKKFTGKSSSAIARGRIVKNEIKDLQLLLLAQPKLDINKHFGSRLVIKDDIIFASFGERGMGMIAQDVDKHPGSIVRIKTDGTVPNDNPFNLESTKNWLPEIYQIGLRNPQGMTLSPFNNKIYFSNHGPRGGDSIGMVKFSGNYGWKKIAWGGTEYSGRKIGQKALENIYDKPLVIWVPSIGIGNLRFYNGKVFPNWHGDILITAAKINMLIRIDLDGNNIVKEEIILKDKIGRIRDIEINKKGDIFLLSDEYNSGLWKITK